MTGRSVGWPVVSGQWLTAVLVWAFAGSMTAQPVLSSDARAKRVVDEAVAALGGDGFLSMADRVESGRVYSFYREEISELSIAKIYTRYLTPNPAKTGEELFVREKQAFGKNEDTSVLFLENAGWEISWRGSKELPKDRVDRYRETTLKNVLYIFRMRLHEPGLLLESRGADVVENQPVEVVDITDSQNRTVTVYFHQTTKLPVKQTYTRRDPETHERFDEVTLFGRYRDVGDGIQWPHQIRRERNGAKVYEIFADSVAVNKDLTDNVFSIPAPGGKKK